MSSEPISDYLRKRMNQRRRLQRKTFWDISSSSESSRSRSRSRASPEVQKPTSPVPEKPRSPQIPVLIETQKPVVGPVLSQDFGEKDVYRVTGRDEKREVDPRFLEHMGYMNRNARPASSKRKEILVRVDERRTTITPASLQERKLREQRLIAQFKDLASRRKTD